MKMTLRFCSTLAVALSLGVGVNAQQNPAPVPESPAPAAPAPAAPAPAAPAPAAPEAAPKTNKPAAKKKSTSKTAAKKKTTTSTKTFTPGAAPAVSTTTRVDIIPAEVGTVKEAAVNVRGRASFIGEVITKLKKGENVSLLQEITLSKPRKDEPARWYKISLPSNTPVWVYAEFIDANKTVVPAKLNLRAGPGENFSPIGILKKGDTVKDLRKVNDWIEIEAPAGAFAYVAADLIDRKGAAAPEVAATPAPVTPAPEPVKPEATTVPEPEPTAKVGTEPTPAPPAEPVAAAPAPAPAPTPAPPAEPQEVVVKRVVAREGIVKQFVSVQAPTDYSLQGLDTKETINYIAPPMEEKKDPKTKKTVMVPLLDLKPYVGKRVLITGEEAVDRRWPLTPILTIQSIEVDQ